VLRSSKERPAKLERVMTEVLECVEGVRGGRHPRNRHLLTPPAGKVVPTAFTMMIERHAITTGLKEASGVLSTDC
jgi:hypothetical protein